MGVVPNAAIIGAGPAGLMAGKSGLNITHTYNFKIFLGRFSAEFNTLENSIKSFTPTMVQQWTSNLGIETFKGSLKRVSPREMKASPILRKWHARLS